MNIIWVRPRFLTQAKVLDYFCIWSGADPGFLKRGSNVEKGGSFAEFHTKSRSSRMKAVCFAILHILFCQSSSKSVLTNYSLQSILSCYPPEHPRTSGIRSPSYPLQQVDLSIRQCRSSSQPERESLLTTQHNTTHHKFI